MATTRLIPLHTGKGRTIAAALQNSTDYIKNPDKTNDGELVTAYACDPRTVDAKFGRDQGNRDVSNRAVFSIHAFILSLV